MDFTSRSTVSKVALHLLWLETCGNEQITCVVVWAGVSDLQGSRRFDPGTDAFQKGKQRVPVVGAVDVGCVSFEKLVQAVRHVSTDSGQNVRLHHQQQSKGEENLRGDTTVRRKSNAAACFRSTGVRARMSCMFVVAGFIWLRGNNGTHMSQCMKSISGLARNGSHFYPDLFGYSVYHSLTCTAV